MRIQNFAKAVIDAINTNTKWNKIMNARQKIATLSLIALGAFGTLKAQKSNDNLLAFNDKVKTTKITDNNDAPVLKEGHSGQAQTISIKKSALVIHISGGTNAKYSAEQYGKMLQIMFKDPKRTKNPTNISVLFEESDRKGTKLMVFSNGRKYDRNGGNYKLGDGVYPVNEIVDDIAKITAHHAGKKNIAIVMPKTKSEEQIASADNYQP